MTNDDRYGRQQGAFPDVQRHQTCLLDLAGEVAPLSSSLVKAGAAAMGIPLIASDYHGRLSDNGHWFSGDHETIVITVNPDVSYAYADPAHLAADLCNYPLA